MSAAADPKNTRQHETSLKHQAHLAAQREEAQQRRLARIEKRRKAKEA